jgi:hypothetical protein
MNHDSMLATVDVFYAPHAGSQNRQQQSGPKPLAGEILGITFSYVIISLVALQTPQRVMANITPLATTLARTKERTH